MSNEFASQADLAKRLGVTQGTVSLGLSAGRVPSAKRVRGRWRIPNLDRAEREWRARTRVNRESRAMRGRKAVKRKRQRQSVPANADALEAEVLERDPGAAADLERVEIAEAQRRYEVARARKMELDLGEREATLHDVTRCNDRFASTAVEIRDKILAVPSKLKRQFRDLDAAAVRRLDGLLREALEALADAAEASEK